MSNDCKFLFTTCQLGAESALKQEIGRQWPEFRLAFSRPGFVTFKVPPSASIGAGLDLRSVFTRTYGAGLGSLVGNDAREMADRFWDLAASSECRNLHVWQRDLRVPGEDGFEPGVSVLAQEIGRKLIEQRPARDRSVALNRIAPARAPILDCVLVEPGQWWIGHHRATSIASRWPGGVFPVEAPGNMVSRSYLKMSEALAWSKMPMERGDQCVEIGVAPGGAAQRLLEQGLHVLGIDPAEVDPVLLENPNFQHIRKRGVEVRRRALRGAKWLFVDSNVHPDHTLDDVETIIGHADVRFSGMLLTLKLANWQLAAVIPQYVQRIRDWGYGYVKARQLAYNRREICIAALQRRAMRRLRSTRKRKTSHSGASTVEAGKNQNELPASGGV